MGVERVSNGFYPREELIEDQEKNNYRCGSIHGNANETLYWHGKLLESGQEINRFAKYIDINFNPDGAKGPTNDIIKIRKFIKAGTSDMIDFIDLMEQDERFHDKIWVVSGFTNPTMAKYAVKHAGFSHLHLWYLSKEEINPEKTKKIGYQLLAIAKNDLIARKPYFQELKQRLEEREAEIQKAIYEKKTQNFRIRIS